MIKCAQFFTKVPVHLTYVRCIKYTFKQIILVIFKGYGVRVTS